MVKHGWFAHKLRVRYQETDQMGVVYHANYLNWFEVARTEYIRALGVTYKILEQQGLFLPVTDAEIKFVQPAKYDDLVSIHTRISRSTALRLEFEYRIFREPGELLVSGVTRHAWLNRDWKPMRIHKEAPELYSLLQERVLKDVQ